MDFEIKVFLKFAAKGIIDNDAMLPTDSALSIYNTIACNLPSGDLKGVLLQNKKECLAFFARCVRKAKVKKDNVALTKPHNSDVIRQQIISMLSDDEAIKKGRELEEVVARLPRNLHRNKKGFSLTALFLSLDTSILVKDGEDDSSVDKCITLLRMSVGLTNVRHLEGIMTIYFQSLQEKTEVIFRERNGESAHRAMAPLEAFLVKCKLRKDYCQPSREAFPLYGDLLTAILSVYLDLFILADSRDLLRRKARNRVLMLVKLLVRDEGERALDVVLQVTLVDLSKQSSFTPLLMYLLRTTPPAGNNSHYLRYMLTLSLWWRVLPGLDNICMMARTVAAEKGFTDWVTRWQPNIFGSLLSDAKFRGVHVTAFILDNADEGVRQLFLDTIAQYTCDCRTSVCKTSNGKSAGGKSRTSWSVSVAGKAAASVCSPGYDEAEGGGAVFADGREPGFDLVDQHEDGNVDNNQLPWGEICGVGPSRVVHGFTLSVDNNRLHRDDDTAADGQFQAEAHCVIDSADSASDIQKGREAPDGANVKSDVKKKKRRKLQMRKHLEIEDNLREDKLFVIDKKGSGYYLDSSSDKIMPGKIPAGPTSDSANFDTDGLCHTFADDVDSEVTVKRRRSKKLRRHSSKIDIDETVLPVDDGQKNGHVGKVKHDGQHKRWSIDVSHADIGLGADRREDVDNRGCMPKDKVVANRHTKVDSDYIDPESGANERDNDEVIVCQQIADERFLSASRTQSTDLLTEDGPVNCCGDVGNILCQNDDSILKSMKQSNDVEIGLAERDFTDFNRQEIIQTEDFVDLSHMDEDCEDVSFGKKIDGDCGNNVQKDERHDISAGGMSGEVKVKKTKKRSYQLPDLSGSSKKHKDLQRDQAYHFTDGPNGNNKSLLQILKKKTVHHSKSTSDMRSKSYCFGVDNIVPVPVKGTKKFRRSMESSLEVLSKINFSGNYRSNIKHRSRSSGDQSDRGIFGSVKAVQVDNCKSLNTCLHTALPDYLMDGVGDYGSDLQDASTLAGNVSPVGSLTESRRDTSSQEEVIHSHQSNITLFGTAPSRRSETGLQEDDAENASTLTSSQGDIAGGEKASDGTREQVSGVELKDRTVSRQFNDSVDQFLCARPSFSDADKDNFGNSFVSSSCSESDVHKGISMVPTINCPYSTSPQHLSITCSNFDSTVKMSPIFGIAETETLRCTEDNSLQIRKHGRQSVSSRDHRDMGDVSSSPLLPTVQKKTINCLQKTPSTVSAAKKKLQKSASPVARRTRYRKSLVPSSPSTNSTAQVTAEPDGGLPSDFLLPTMSDNGVNCSVGNTAVSVTNTPHTSTLHTFNDKGGLVEGGGGRFDGGQSETSENDSGDGKTDKLRQKQTSVRRKSGKIARKSMIVPGRSAPGEARAGRNTPTSCQGLFTKLIDSKNSGLQAGAILDPKKCINGPSLTVSARRGVDSVECKISSSEDNEVRRQSQDGDEYHLHLNADGDLHSPRRADGMHNDISCMLKEIRNRPILKTLSSGSNSEPQCNSVHHLNISTHEALPPISCVTVARHSPMPIKLAARLSPRKKFMSTSVNKPVKRMTAMSPCDVAINPLVGSSCDAMSVKRLSSDPIITVESANDADRRRPSTDSASSRTSSLSRQSDRKARAIVNVCKTPVVSECNGDSEPTFVKVITTLVATPSSTEFLSPT